MNTLLSRHQWTRSHSQMLESFRDLGGRELVFVITTCEHEMDDVEQQKNQLFAPHGSIVRLEILSMMNNGNNSDRRRLVRQRMEDERQRMRRERQRVSSPQVGDGISEQRNLGWRRNLVRKIRMSRWSLYIDVLSSYLSLCYCNLVSAALSIFVIEP